MEQISDGSAPAGVESKQMDDDLERTEREKPEEKAPMLLQEFEKMRLGSQTDPSENVSPATNAPQAVDYDAATEDSQGDTSRLLQLSCKFDSTSSLSSLLERMPVDFQDDSGKTPLHYAAEQHSVRCIEFLLKRRAKPDMKSANGLIALEIALQSERMQMLSWSPADKITELLTSIVDKVSRVDSVFQIEKALRDIGRACRDFYIGIVPRELQGYLVIEDLDAVKLLADQTRDLAEVASRLIVQGNIIALAALLVVAGHDIISTSLLATAEHGDGTLFDVLVKKAISTGQQCQDHELNNGKECHTSETTYNLRQTLLKELELFLRWYLDHHQSRDNRHRTPPTSSVPSPLLRSAQAGDDAIVGALIEHGSDVNETDSGGNTALHWALRATANTRDIRVVVKLLRYGASITMGNRLGLTPLHIASGQGHLQALQILLALEPSSVDVTAETKETPLFSAVKGNHYECVRVLLQYGASRQVLNLRKQRPIDVAETSDMRALLYLQESSGRVKDLNSLRQSSMLSLEGSYAGYDYDTLLRFQNETRSILEYSDESLNPSLPEKSEMCRYFSMPGGCVRGDKCFYAHREEELQGRPRMSTGETKGFSPSNAYTTPSKIVKRESEDLSKKIFVGGLSPSVESEDLREFFEAKFGPVVDAIVIGSHAGDHVQSRGFGFVTFKNEESVIAAVQAHYVNIFGKKVEIKGAVPRSVLPTLECAKAGLELSRLNSDEASKFSEIDITKVHDMSSLELLCQGKGDLQLQLTNYLGHHGEKCEPVTTQSEGTLSSASARSSRPTSQDITWVPKFKKWLPTFLGEVSKRLKEGEWYPLSSLKGDFRATCGLELDHIAAGYHKLSDFIRALPEACRMKIVPVGRGPATHMVLLPALPRLTSTVPAPTLKAIAPTACSALVDAGRSYAAAACELPGKSNMESSVNVRSLVPQPSPAGNRMGQFESQAVYNTDTKLPGSTRSTYEEARLPDSWFSQHHTAFLNNGLGQALRPSIPQNQFEATGSLMQEADRSNLRELLAPTDKCDVQHGEDRNFSTTGSEFLSANNSNSIFMAQPHGSMATKMHQDDPKTPVRQVNLRPFSTVNHPFTGFLPQDCVDTYSMWGRHLGKQGQNNQTIAKPKPVGVKSSDHIRLWEDSPQSILHPYDRTYSQFGSQEAPRSVFSPAGKSPVDDRTWGASCVYCCQRQSMWVAIPCYHYALCAICKDALHKLNRSTANCPVCASHVERWIAFH